MQPLVMKFGGTSVADARAIAGVVRIVGKAAEGGAPIVVVVSAMSGITDELVRASDAARRGAVREVHRCVDAIHARHAEALAELFESGAPDVAQEVSRECEELRAVLGSVAVLRELTPRGADRVSAAGELMSSRILAGALSASGVPASWADPRKLVVTDDSHPAAIPLPRETRAAALRELGPVIEAGDVAVVGGFVGATIDGITTTLGRGGSDFSASLIGAAVNAREIQIWTDVDGMLTADPRVVDGAEVVPQLSFDEASELAYFGAKVLHPSTILPAVEDGIPVRILNTHRPDLPGSLITRDGSAADRPLAALACKRNITVVDVTSTRMLLAHGFLRRVFEIFEHHATSVDVVTTSEVSVSMTVDDDRRLAAIERELRLFSDVRVEEEMAIVSAVGDNLRRDPGLAVRLIAALDGLQLRMVSQAAARRNVTVVLADRDVPAAMRRLHQNFFEPARSA